MNRLLVTVLFACCLALSACGKKSDPKSPNPDRPYPQSYPATR